MKLNAIAILTTAAAMTACTTTEMVATAQAECTQIGYAQSSPEYAQCTERGYRTMDAQQDAVVSSIAMWAILEAAY